MKRLQPFFSYYGSKWRLAPLYEKPKHNIIIEPFAGSAAYSTLYPNHDILLVDKNPIVCQVWDYLINVSEEEFNKLPIEFYHVDELTGVIPEAKLFIGFWIARMRDHVSYKKTPRALDPTERSGYWSDVVKARVCNQLKYIRHWKTKCDDYINLDNTESTWHIDPPYNTSKGKHYPIGKDIDYKNLAEWSKTRNGQVMVCEMEPSNWLPFKLLKEVSRSHPPSCESLFNTSYSEVVWYK